MMKHCQYCGTEIHENASFCPYCMKSQIEKQRTIIQKEKSRKWLYILMITAAMIAVIAVLSVFLNNDINQAQNNSDTPIETTDSTSTTATEPIVTTTTQAEVTASATEPMTTSTESTTVTTTETVPQETTFQLGDYITEGKTLSQIQGYGGYADMGGIVLTIEDITDATLTFSIVQYSESGLASDTVSARNITAEIIGNTAEFEFRDILDGKGAGKITLENGKVHIETFGDTNRPTSIIVNAYLTHMDS